MAEDTATTADSSEETTTEEQPDASASEAATVRSLRAEARRWRTEAQENRHKASEFDKLQAATKTEAQRQAEAQLALQRRAEEAEARALRLEVAHEKNLPVALARRLQGSTREEIESDADELTRSLGSQTGKAKVSDAGQRASGEAPGKSPSEYLRQRLTER